MSEKQHELLNLVTIGDTKMGVELKDGVTRVAISGNLIYGNKDPFKQLVLDELERGRREFVIDLTRCSYIDSSGLGVLVSISRKIQTVGGTLALEGLNQDLQVLFELTKLDKLFTIREANG